jgi:hypothetical protein
MRRLLPWLTLTAAVIPLAGGHAGGQQTPLVLDNGLVRVVVTRQEGGFTEQWFGKAGDTWVLVMESGNDMRGAQTAGFREGPLVFRLDEGAGYAAPGDPRIELRAVAGTDTLLKTIRLEAGGRFGHITVSFRCAAPAAMSSLLSTYSFTPGGREYSAYAPIDFVYTPQLRPEKDEVIADHTFRSPAFILQEGTVAGAIIPALSSIDGKDRPLRSGADLQVEGLRRPLVSFGLMNWQRTKHHVYYFHADTMLSRVPPGAIGYGYYLYVNARAPERKAYREIVRFLWDRYGSRNFLEPAGPQAEPFAAYVRKAWYEFVPSVALDTVYEGVPVTLLRQGRLAWSNKLPPAADNDSWFNVWFNALRTAYGMHLYGRQSGDSSLLTRAERVVNLALRAPRAGGLAPTVFYLDSAGGHWVADHAWGGIEDGRLLPMFHNAWTALWMLRWSDRLPARRAELTAYARGIADFFIAHQRPSGVVPSWYDPVTGEPHPVFRDENAETAGASLLLAEYALRTGEPRYRQAAERSIRYVLREIVPERKWFDFETFFSCSRKPVGFYDSVTHQHPQNTLSMQMAADACARLYTLTGDTVMREEGCAILDYLCLYQQVWSPQWLSCPLFGGFGVQNTDGEWSDARQGYFALTLLDYYDLTGRREYFERGVAALRAMFSLFESPASPRTAENYGHGAYDALAGVTGLHWGTGSSVTSVHIAAARYGDAYVSIGGGWGAGIDGCRVTSVAAGPDTVHVTILDNVATRRIIRVTFGTADRRPRTVIANGVTLGRFDSAGLSRGIHVDL